MSGTTSEKNQRRRNAFRLIGGVLVAVGLVFLVVAMVDFLGAMGSNDFDARPTKFWMAFVGLPLIAVGGWLLQAGFLGAVSSYVADESAPALRTAGEALGTHPAPGAFCRQCGKRGDAGSRFCDACGSALV